MAYVAVTHEPLDSDRVMASVGGDEDGAVLLFMGTVRNHADDRPVSGMRYEGYEEMAVEMLRRIADEASERFHSPSIAVVHRLGDLRVGDVSVMVAVSSPHRAEAYGASRYIMEEIKTRLPVWKKEFYTDGTTDWVEGVTPATPGQPSGSRSGQGSTRE